MQNAAATPAYTDRIAAGWMAGTRGHAHSAEDRLRDRVIEMIMCDFAIDLPRLCDTLSLFSIGVSWGGFESLILPARATKMPGDPHGALWRVTASRAPKSLIQN